MLNVLIMVIVTLIALHVASYGLYALREEQNIRGAAGAFVTAGITWAAPVVLMWFNLSR